jgi:hypothetical protein
MPIRDAGLQIVRLKGSLTDTDLRDEIQMRLRIEAFLRSDGGGSGVEKLLHGPDNKVLRRNNLIDLLSEEIDPRKALQQLRWDPLTEACRSSPLT